MCEILNDSLFKVDKRFKDLNWPIFDDLHYVLKVSYDTLYYHAELISKIIQKFDPDELIIGDNYELKIDENLSPHEFKVFSKKRNKFVTDEV